MYKICGAEQMRRADYMTINTYGIPGIVLMENAAAACYRRLLDLFDVKKTRFAIFCGKGNNGGDGFAIARMLYNAGGDVTVYLLFGREYFGDALTNFEAAEKIGCEIIDIYQDSLYSISEYDVVVDAIFGTGVHGEIEGMAKEVIDEINNNAKFILSVDVPSGLNTDTGEICGVCVNANETITFAAYKRGMFLFPGADFCGKVTPVDICMPKNILEEMTVSLIDKEEICKIIPRRKDNSHKGDFGKVLTIAGSVGMTGAAAMCSMASMKSGAGLVSLCIPQSLNTILEQKVTEVMTIPLADDNGMLIDCASDDITWHVQNSDAVVFGPGLGRNDDILSILKSMLWCSSVPVVIDADGLYALSCDTNIFDNCSCEVILTPHSAELARLMGCSVAEIEADRIGMCAAASEKFGATIILKGRYTIVTASDGTQYINNTGNSGMASGGSGDVLAGMIGAFVGMGMSCKDSAVAAVYLHGLAGDIASKKLGKYSMTATDILENISNAFLDVCN